MTMVLRSTRPVTVTIISKRPAHSPPGAQTVLSASYSSRLRRHLFLLRTRQSALPAPNLLVPKFPCLLLILHPPQVLSLSKHSAFILEFPTPIPSGREASWSAARRSAAFAGRWSRRSSIASPSPQTISKARLTSRALQKAPLELQLEEKWHHNQQMLNDHTPPPADGIPSKRLVQSLRLRCPSSSQKIVY